MRDVVVSLVTALLLVAAVQVEPTQQVIFDKTPEARKFMLLLMLCEVTFVLAGPWVLLLVFSPLSGNQNKDALSYILTTHLFIFQAQIALERIITIKYRHGMAFWFTVIANTYRGVFGVLTWISRYMELRGDMHGPAAPLVDTLSASVIVLWILSNVYIFFEWYPCLKPGPKKI